MTVRPEPRRTIDKLAGEPAAWQDKPFQPDETLMNDALAEIGCDPNPAIRSAVIAGFWPLASRAHRCDTVLEVRARRSGVDFAAGCPACGARPVQLAENKPRAAKIHYKAVDSATWARALAMGLVLPTTGLTSPPADTCSEPHSWSDACDGYWHGWLDREHTVWELRLPQVVTDAVEYALPVTVVTDSGTASDLYQTAERGFYLSERHFPCVTPAGLLHGMAAAMPALTREERRRVERAFTLVWSRVGWGHRLSRQAKRYVAAWVDDWPDYSEGRG